MGPRNQNDAHRAATPLELFFDLCFVAAIALDAASLHHGLSEDHIGESIVPFFTTFFAIWWAWMNFTWFASAYDTDDAPYRLATFVQMGGVLVLAAGITRAFEDNDFTIVTIGYVIMRVALVSLWFRAAHADPSRKTTNLRYAFGVALVQIGWLGLLFVPEEFSLVGFLLLVVAELAVPMFAEQASATPWHPEHIAERYGLFTIIVIGESVISTTRGFQAALDEGADQVGLISLGIASLVIVCSCWWLYFDRQSHYRPTADNRIFGWGYGHYLIFAALAAIGAGLASAVDYHTDHSLLSAVETGYAIAIPVAVFLGGLWFFQIIYFEATRASGAFLMAIALVLLAPLTGIGIYLVAVIVALLVAANLLLQPGEASTAHDASTSGEGLL